MASRTPTSPSVLALVTVDRVERLSPAFVRIWFAGPDLAEFGNPGETFDQRIKVIFPPTGGRVPRLVESADWWQQWQALPEAERGAMRTYSIRDIVGTGPSTRVAVDFVLHGGPTLHPSTMGEPFPEAPHRTPDDEGSDAAANEAVGISTRAAGAILGTEPAEGPAPRGGHSGPASRWASAAKPCDEVLLVGPRRGEPWGGVEFRPGVATSLLLAGDETAAPAISRILLDLEPGTTGDVFIEVPSQDDILPLAVPPGFELHWLPREAGATFGSRLVPAVVEHLGVHPHGRIQDADTEFPVWETPAFSSLGEVLEDDPEPPGRYAWIAGESGVVTTLRRHLVREVGLARSQVAFMGYWRHGAAMRG